MTVTNSTIMRGVILHDPVNIYNSTIGTNTKIAAFVEIGGAIIGKDCKIEAFSYICPGVTIEDGCFIGPHVTFTNDRNPLKSMEKNEFAPLPILVKYRAVIGAGAIILPGVIIGAYSMTGAGAVVTKDVPDRAVVIGNPARVIR